MIRTLSGVLALKKEQYIVVETGGVGFKVAVPKSLMGALPSAGNMVKLFTYLAVRENALDLYGFLRESELELFERLNTVSGIGPKSALAIMGVAPVDQLAAAINEGRTELLTRVSGIGKKTAERVVLDLKGKLSLTSSPQMLELMESDNELEETLAALGFSRAQAKTAVGKIDPTIKDFKLRLREALKKAK